MRSKCSKRVHKKKEEPQEEKPNHLLLPGLYKQLLHVQTEWTRLHPPNLMLVHLVLFGLTLVSRSSPLGPLRFNLMRTVFAVQPTTSGTRQRCVWIMSVPLLLDALSICAIKALTWFISRGNWNLHSVMRRRLSHTFNDTFAFHVSLFRACLYVASITERTWVVTRSRSLCHTLDEWHRHGFL